MSQNEQQVSDLLIQLRALIADAKGVPLSSSVLVPRDQALEIIDRCIGASPHEVTEAQAVLRERDTLLTEVRREAGELLNEARERAELMLTEQELVKVAHVRAARITAQAEEQAAHLKRQTEDYIDRRLANFEIVLSDLLEQARRGRRRLAATSEQNSTDQARGDDFFGDPAGGPLDQPEDGGDSSDA